MRITSATSLSSLVSASVSSEKILREYCIGTGEIDKIQMRSEQTESVSSTSNGGSQSLPLCPKSQLSEVIRLYCEESFRTSKDSLSSLQKVFLYYILVQVNFISNNFAYAGGIITTRFAASIAWRQFQSHHQIPHVTSDDHSELSYNGSMHSSWDSSLSSSTIQDEDNLSVSSTTMNTQRQTEDDIRTKSEEVSKSSTFIPTSVDEDADEWGHFMDFQEPESIAAANNMADPFQSLSKTILRRRGVKVSVCKLDQLQEENSFIMREVE